MLGNRRNVRKLKVANDENPASKVAQTVAAVKATVQTGTRAALGDVSNNTRKTDSRTAKGKGVADVIEKPTIVVSRRNTSNVPVPQRQPLASRASIGARPPVRPSGRSISSVLAGTIQNSSGAPVRPLPARARTMDTLGSRSTTVQKPVAIKVEGMDIEADIGDGGDTDIEDEAIMEDVEEVDEPEENEPAVHDVKARIEEDEEMDEDDWTMASPKTNAKYQAALAYVKANFKDDIDQEDMTMVSEYANEIFAYMGKLEIESMPNPTYMDGQTEIEWPMRKTLIDWLLQVHLRYHMLPETLWIAVNIVDRFLSRRVVSLVKLQLVGVTAMFVASKYEEIMAPSVDEFSFMTENGYSREEILKGEKIVLQTLDFNVSPYCSPYSWVRRISKADDYDIQTRTLCKFLMEVTLLDHRFLRAKPSMIAAIGMYTSKRMLNGSWDDAFVYHSDFTEEQLVPGFHLLLEDLTEAGFENGFVCKKYANKKFLKASLFARDWALNYLQPPCTP